MGEALAALERWRNRGSRSQGRQWSLSSWLGGEFICRLCWQEEHVTREQSRIAQTPGEAIWGCLLSFSPVP